MIGALELITITVEKHVEVCSMQEELACTCYNVSPEPKVGRPLGEGLRCLGDAGHDEAAKGLGRAWLAGGGCPGARLDGAQGHKERQQQRHQAMAAQHTPQVLSSRQPGSPVIQCKQVLEHLQQYV